MKDRCLNLCKYLSLAFVFSFLYACGGGSSSGGENESSANSQNSNDVTNIVEDLISEAENEQDQNDNTSDIGNTDDTNTGDNDIVVNDPPEDDGSDQNNNNNNSNDSSESEKVTIVVSWDIPQSRADGDELLMSEISGYTIRYKFNSDTSYSFVEVDEPTADSSEIEVSLQAGTYEFSIMTRDTSGLSSDYSTPQAIELTI